MKCVGMTYTTFVTFSVTHPGNDSSLLPLKRGSKGRPLLCDLCSQFAFTSWERSRKAEKGSRSWCGGTPLPRSKMPGLNFGCCDPSNPAIAVQINLFWGVYVHVNSFSSSQGHIMSANIQVFVSRSSSNYPILHQSLSVQCWASLARDLRSVWWGFLWQEVSWPGRQAGRHRDQRPSGSFPNHSG